MKNPGNKSANLLWLKSNRFYVPDFSVIFPVEVLANYAQIRNSIFLEIEKNGLEKADTGPILDRLEYAKGIDSRLDRFYGKKTAFRTSSSLEDAPGLSFAGLYETYLDIDFTEINFRQYFLRCVRSVFSARVFSYLKTNGINPEALDCAVIIQEMFHAGHSGVSFVYGNDRESETAWASGSCKNIVDGAGTSRFNFDDVPDDFKKLKHAGSLLDALRKIQALKGRPQDIEWSLSESGFCVLQTRDITRGLPRSGESEIYDCTNISESYPGITMPLTYSFINSLYSKVYISFFSMLGTKILPKHKPIFDNLLGYIKGRVYYRIANWYGFLKLLPGYKYNKEFFESMLVPQKKLENETGKKPAGFDPHNLPVAAKFAYKLFFHGKDDTRFLEDFNKKFRLHRQKNLAVLSNRELFDYYEKSRDGFLDDWRTPIANDFRLMVFHGILKRLIMKKGGQDPQVAINRVMSGFSKENYYEGIRELEGLSLMVRENKKLAAIFSQPDGKKIFREISQSEDPWLAAFNERLAGYFDRHCWRKPDELKLESIEIKDDPSLIINLIKHYPRIVENKNDTAVPGGIFAGFIAKRTKAAIKNREIFRAKRAMVFSVAKDCFMQLAANFERSRVVDAAADIHYLTVEDIKKIIGRDGIEEDCRSLVAKRKEIIDNYKIISLPERIIVSGYGDNAVFIDDTAGSSQDLKGMPTSSGIATAKVLVLEKFDPDADFEGKILVTYQTDPGWSIIFPLLKGIILEKGNALSHASILSREMGIPSVVKLKNAVSLFKNGQTVELNGNDGNIKILEE